MIQKEPVCKLNLYDWDLDSCRAGSQLQEGAWNWTSIRVVHRLHWIILTRRRISDIFFLAEKNCTRYSIFDELRCHGSSIASLSPPWKTHQEGYGEEEASLIPWEGCCQRTRASRMYRSSYCRHSNMLAPFQMLDRFNFFRYIVFAIHLNILCV